MRARNAYLRTESTNGEIAATMGSAPPELEDGPPDGDAVALLEEPLRHRRLVHHRAVGRSEIGQNVTPWRPADLRVLPGGAGILEHDVGFAEPPDRHDVLVEREGLTASSVLDEREAAGAVGGGLCGGLIRRDALHLTGHRTVRSLHERGLAPELTAPERRVRLEAHLRRADELPAPLGRPVADELAEL